MERVELKSSGSVEFQNIIGQNVTESKRKSIIVQLSQHLTIDQIGIISRLDYLDYH